MCFSECSRGRLPDTGAGGYIHRHRAGVSGENSHKNKKALFLTNYIQC
nr:MAG TPA: hypothetical protein [Caudoviricetes sp.]